MNTYFNILIKLMIFLIILLLTIFGLYFVNLPDSELNNFFKEEPTNVKKDTPKPSIDKINDSINQREDRIKALKEIGKKLGG